MYLVDPNKLRYLSYLLILVFSVLNPIVAQVGWYFFPEGIAGFTLMQLFQGIFYIYVVLTIPLLKNYANAYSVILKRLIIVFLICLTFSHLRLWLIGQIDVEFVEIERMHYFKIIFSMTLWYYISLVVKDKKDAITLLKSIIIGCFLTGTCIVYFYYNDLGTVKAYAYAGVKASFGAEGSSGKAIVGFMLTGTVLSIYLQVKHYLKYGSIIAMFLILGIILTYDRSGQVALVCYCIWMLVWYVFYSDRRSEYRLITRGTALLFCISILYFVNFGFEQLTARWEYDFNQGVIGSGRGTFYITSIKWLIGGGELPDLIFGMGFGNILPLMNAASGIYVHTHSDFFDMMLAIGIIGILLFIYLFRSTLNIMKGMDVGSVDYSSAFAVFIVFFIMCCFTGQFSATHAMFCFMTSIYCIKIASANCE